MSFLRAAAEQVVARALGAVAAAHRWCRRQETDMVVGGPTSDVLQAEDNHTQCDSKEHDDFTDSSASNMVSDIVVNGPTSDLLQAEDNHTQCDSKDDTSDESDDAQPRSTTNTTNVMIGDSCKQFITSPDGGHHNTFNTVVGTNFQQIVNLNLHCHTSAAVVNAIKDNKEQAEERGEMISITLASSGLNREDETKYVREERKAVTILNGEKPEELIRNIAELLGNLIMIVSGSIELIVWVDSISKLTMFVQKFDSGKFDVPIKTIFSCMDECVDNMKLNVTVDIKKRTECQTKVEPIDIDRPGRDLQPIQWYYIEVTGANELQKYDKYVNDLIERNYQDGKPSVSFCDSTGKLYELDFANMKEYPVDSPHDTVQVIRRELMKDASFEPPPEWSQMAKNEHLRVVSLAPTDKEYIDVAHKFNPAFYTKYKIKIERIQNKTLYQQYEAKKKLLDQHNPAGHQNEHLLWHGTAAESVDSINAFGFNRSYCRDYVGAFGDGVYFAEKALYSYLNSHSRPDSNGLKRLYYSRVLTGVYTLGKAAMRVPPFKAGALSHDVYDSVVGNMSGSWGYTIFNDNQAYPQYLITFRD